MLFVASLHEVCANILPLGFIGSPSPIFGYFSSARLRVVHCLSGSPVPWCCLCAAQHTAVLKKLLTWFTRPFLFHKASFPTTAAPLLLKHGFCVFVQVLPFSWDALFISSISQDPIHSHPSKMDSDVSCHLLEPTATRQDEWVIPCVVLLSHSIGT